MNAEIARRVREGLWLFVTKILNTAVVLVNKLCTRWSPSPSPAEGENENEHSPNRTLAAQPNNGPHWPTLLVRTGTASNSNGRSRYFNSGRRIPGAVFFFFNVNNIFNVSHHQPFSLNFVFAPTILMLLSFLQTQGSLTNSASPRKLHPVIFMAAVICSLAYYFSFAAKFMFPHFASLFEVLVSASGSSAVASLICLVLQLPWWSIFFILLFLGGLFKLLKKLHGKYGNIRRRPRTGAAQPLLPLHNVMFNHESIQD